MPGPTVEKAQLGVTEPYSALLPVGLIASLPCVTSVLEQLETSWVPWERPPGPHQICHSSLGAVCAPVASGPPWHGQLVGRVLQLALPDREGIC